MKKYRIAEHRGFFYPEVYKGLFTGWVRFYKPRDVGPGHYLKTVVYFQSLDNCKAFLADQVENDKPPKIIPYP